jgi:hypothetical protein
MGTYEYEFLLVLGVQDAKIGLEINVKKTMLLNLKRFFNCLPEDWVFFSQ